MTWVSISKLAELTGSSTRTVRSRCESLDSRVGKKNAKLYDSKRALPFIYRLNGSGDLHNPAAEKARLDRLRADQIELKLATDQRIFEFALCCCR